MVYFLLGIVSTMLFLFIIALLLEKEKEKYEVVIKTVKPGYEERRHSLTCQYVELDRKKFIDYYDAKEWAEEKLVYHKLKGSQYSDFSINDLKN